MIYFAKLIGFMARCLTTMTTTATNFMGTATCVADFIVVPGFGC